MSATELRMRWRIEWTNIFGKQRIVECATKAEMEDMEDTLQRKERPHKIINLETGEIYAEWEE